MVLHVDIQFSQKEVGHDIEIAIDISVCKPILYVNNTLSVDLLLQSVITDSVFHTESVIIAIRKVVPQKYGAHPIDCASNINVPV